MKKMTKTISILIAAAMVFTMMPVIAMADGSIFVDDDYLVLHPGETASITVGAENAAGRVDWSGDGSVSAFGSAWLDNGSATIDITADSVGTGYIYITPTNIATYDGEEIDYGYTITVEVVDDSAADEPAEDPVDEPAEDPADDYEEPVEAPVEEPAQTYVEPAMQQDDNDVWEQPAEPATEQETTTQAPQTEAQTEAPQAEQGPVLTDGKTDYDDLTNEDRLYTDVDGQELYIIQYPRWIAADGSEIWNDEVFNLDMLTGFELKTVNYKNVSVDSFQYRDLLSVFVLKNLETDVSNYYTLEDGEGFSPLTYVTANGKQYIVVDFPEDFIVPEGYQMVEMTLGSNKVHALKKISTEAPAETQPAEETEPAAEPETAAEEQAEVTQEGDALSIIIDGRTQVMLKGYETEVSPGLDSADPSDDIYYLYCLVDGDTQLYSYDSGEGTLQRASIVVYHEIPTEPETVIIYETSPAEEPETAAAEGAFSFLKGIGWKNMQLQMKILVVSLGVAILLIIILIILFACMSKRNKKRSQKNNRNRSNRKKKNTANRKTSRDAIPPRTYQKSDSEKEDDEAFFSYVKTAPETKAEETEKKDEFDLNDLF